MQIIFPETLSIRISHGSAQKDANAFLGDVLFAANTHLSCALCAARGKSISCEGERERERESASHEHSVCLQYRILFYSHCVCRTALSKAEVLLSMRLQDSCLERVWGAGGAARPVRVLRKQFEEVVREYLVNNELSEAVNAVLELDVPHYAHELVHRAVCAWLELRTMFVRELCADARPDPTGAETRHLLALFKGLSDACVLSSEQFLQVCTPHFFSYFARPL